MINKKVLIISKHAISAYPIPFIILRKQVKFSIVMKKGIFLVLLAIMATVCSCDREPIPIVSYIKQHGLDKEIADSLAGTYEGKLRVLMFDGNEEKFQDESGVWKRVAYVDSILNYKFTIGGFSNRQISFPDFPISWVANSIKDKTLKETFAKLPNTSILFDYEINGDPVPGIHMGYMYFKSHPIVLTFKMNGEEHKAEFIFADNSIWSIDADDKSAWQIPHFGIQLTWLKIDGKDTNYFSQWENNDGEEFLTWISHTNKVGK